MDAPKRKIVWDPWPLAVIGVGVLVLVLNFAAYRDQPDGYWFGAAAIVVGLVALLVVGPYFRRPPKP